MARRTSTLVFAALAGCLAAIGAAALAAGPPGALAAGSSVVHAAGSAGALSAAPGAEAAAGEPPSSRARGPRFEGVITPATVEALVQQYRFGGDPFAPSIGPREFFFTRAIYSGRRRGGSWSTDYPKADRQFLWGLRRLTNIDAYEGAHAIRLDDPDLRRFPFLYALEVGYMRLTPPEVEGLREYLLRGGFLVIDDFWGTYEWQNFERELRRVLPEHRIIELPMSHPLFRIFYEIDEVLQVPSIRYARYGGPTWQRDGYEPLVRAVFDDDGRLMVVINANTDLGDAWEWAEDPYYPLDRSTFAYQMAVNMILYAMSH